MSAAIEEKEGKAQSKTYLMRQRTYTDSEKAEALARLDMNEGLLSKTSRETGIPVSTLFSWDNGRGISPRVEGMRKVKREELGEELRQVALLGARLAQEKIVDAEFRDLMVGTGIAVQRSAELLGESQPQGTSDAAQIALKAIEALFKLAQERNQGVTIQDVARAYVERKPELKAVLTPLLTEGVKQS